MINMDTVQYDFFIEILNKICSIDYSSDLQWKLEENSQVIPVIPP